MTKLLALILAYVFLALAFIGIFMPIIPTVPFLLLSAWFALRGSPKLHDWLWNHPRFGPILQDWQEGGTISRRSKISALTMLIISWAITYYLTELIWVPVMLALLFMVIGFYIVSRPEAELKDKEAE